MKKYIIMAILASLVILPGCKKKTTETKVDGQFLTKIYNDCNKLVGSDSAVAVQAILAEGWKATVEEGGSYIKVVNGDSMMLIVNWSEISSKVIFAECFFSNIAGDENLTQADWKALVQNIGEKPTVAGVEVPFKELAYGESPADLETKATTYQAAIDALSDAFAAGSFEYNWAATSRDISIGKRTDGTPKGYSITVSIVEPK